MHERFLTFWASSTGTTSLALAAMLIAASGIPRQAIGQSIIEEIVVTARLREERIQDVPVAVTALAEQTIERLNLNSVRDVAEQIPSFQISQRGAGASAALYLRGIGSDSIDAAFDSAVAFNFDGIPANSARLIANSNLDIRQFEILKGPQSLYFGKGASAGVVSIQSADPGEAFEGRFSAAYEFEERGTVVEGMLSGPVYDALRARLAVKTVNAPDVTPNSAVGVAKSNRGEESIDARLTLDLDAFDSLTANLKIGVSNYENDGLLLFTDIECAGSTPQLSAYPQLAAGAFTQTNDYDCNYRDRKIQISDQNAVVAQGFPDNNNGVPYDEQELTLARLKLEWFASDSLTLTSVSSYFDLDEKGIDCYSYDTNGNNCVQGENRTEALSQEIRLESNFGGRFEFMLGAFYQDRDLLHLNRQDAFSGPVLFSLVAGMGDPSFAIDPVTGFTFDWLKVHPTKHTTTSVFGSVNFELSDRLDATIGARWSDEEKSNIYSAPFVHSSFGVLTPGLVAPSGFRVPIGFKDDNVSPEFSLSYSLTANTLLYGAYKTGFKSGGISYSQLPAFGTYFNLLAGDVSDLVFDSETVEGFEIGLKSDAGNQDLQLDVVAFNYVFDDLQVQQFDPTTFAFATFNAGEVTSRGLEFDLRYDTVMEGFSVRTSIAFLDTEYTDDFVNIAGINLNGERRQNAPEIAGNAGFDFTTNAGDTLTAGLSATAHYSGRYRTSDGNFGTPDETFQESFWRGDVVAFVGSHDESWRVTLTARNIGDEIYSIDTIGRPGTIPTTAAGGRRDMVHFQNRGRQVFLEALLRF